MSLLVININDQSLDRLSAEAAFAEYAVKVAMLEFSRARGNRTSGPILGTAGSGVGSGPVSLGSWTYTPSATKS